MLDADMKSFTSILFIMAANLSAIAEPTEQQKQFQAETERAFAQEAKADVVVFYDTATTIQIQRPETKEPFPSENKFLQYLQNLKGPKDLLVVILSKRHKFTDSKQTVDGFWEACKKTGFKQVVIQLAHSSGRPILHE